MATFMFFSVLVLFLHRQSKGSKIGCAPGSKYICTGFKTNLTGTIVIAEDTTFCVGVCENSFCSGTWSAWSTKTPVVYDRDNVLISNTERRQRPCGNKKSEIELRHRDYEDTVGFRNSSKHPRIKRRFFQKLSGAINGLVDRSRRTMKFNFVVSVGQKVKLSCDTTGHEALKKAFPKSKIRWVLNNHPLKIVVSRMKVQRLQLEIRNVNPHDQGLYTCQVFYKKKRRKIVYFATVTTKEVGVPIEVTEKDTLKLRCPSSPIGRMFAASYRGWTQNRKPRITNILAKLRFSEDLRNASKKHEGIWSCHVTDRSTKRRWDVVSFQVIVLPLPPPDNSFKKFFRDNIFLIVSQSLGVLGFIIVTFICLCHNPKTPKSDDEKEKLIKDEDDQYSNDQYSYDQYSYPNEDEDDQYRYDQYSYDQYSYPKTPKSDDEKEKLIEDEDDQYRYDQYSYPNEDEDDQYRYDQYSYDQYSYPKTPKSDDEKEKLIEDEDDQYRYDQYSYPNEDEDDQYRYDQYSYDQYSYPKTPKSDDEKEKLIEDEDDQYRYDQYSYDQYSYPKNPKSDDEKEKLIEDEDDQYRYDQYSYDQYSYPKTPKSDDEKEKLIEDEDDQYIYNYDQYSYDQYSYPKTPKSEDEKEKLIEDEDDQYSYDQYSYDQYIVGTKNI